MNRLKKKCLLFLVTAVLSIAPAVVQAQPVQQLPECGAQCTVPLASVCNALFGGNAVNAPGTQSNCDPSCRPTRTQCANLALCPTATICVPPPSRPTSPREEQPMDICEVLAGAVPDISHPGTCTCVRDSARLAFIGQPRRYHRQWRLRLTDRTGAAHVGCFDQIPEAHATVPAPSAPAANPSTSPASEPVPPGLSREEVERIVTDGVNRANEARDRNIRELQARTRWRLGLGLSLGLQVIHLPGDRVSNLTYPVGAASITVDRPHATRFMLNMSGGLGAVDTGGYGHRCNGTPPGQSDTSLAVEANLRVGYSLGGGRHVVPFLGLGGSWAILPCQAPFDGSSVTEQLYASAGLGAGVLLDLPYGLMIFLEGRFNFLHSRYTESLHEDHTGVIPGTLGATLIWNFLDL